MAELMTNLMPPWPLFSAFLIASVVLAVTPGPGVFYIVTRTLVYGRRSGLVSVGAVALGNFGNVIAASMGLAALFAASSTAFVVVKYAGACYLVYLGVQTLRNSSAGEAVAMPRMVSHGRVFHEGFIVALLNPKTTLFFAAFLPQFVSLDGLPMLQTVVMGALFVVIAAITDSLYALVAGSVMPRLSRVSSAGRVGRYLGGGTFIGLGLFAMVSGERVSK